jgi:NADH-quinone oxidoreductase subunit F
MSPRLTSISDLRNLRQSLKGLRDGKKPCITICAGTGCQATNALEVVEKFRQEIMDQHLAEKIEVRASGCHGFCERGPLVVIRPQMICYTNVDPTDVSRFSPIRCSRER